MMKGEFRHNSWISFLQLPLLLLKHNRMMLSDLFVDIVQAAD
jgi:hypothetical protein